ncbi:cyclic pyranopterin monophosphate synthase subunit MoaA [Malonomonas rubra DSM 5091]|uniref:GTP 3',8-cyclase n=1 Tax=Malonomonas rubra DSM 5091 TaxID=1122189 RepID=A0A1M6GD31_MALRU|nr:GTP 3',8-cyclase MoaA [Malonomonas rubra]SHJ07851.1 cyclic pyranopterin monophosphate synthase subunit MoaA [Malonomonas rubra DSM 5091]
MRDSYARKIDYLRISITDRCNLRCRYCMPEEGVASVGHGAVLSYEELYRVARIAVERGVRKIRLTGGEPLVRKGVVDFIASLVALPEKPELTLTTNGVLLSDYAEPLRQAGLARINVSLDSLQAERFKQITRRDQLQSVLDGLRAAEAAGLAPIKINMVPIRGVNEDEIAAFARLSYKHNWEVRFIEFMPVSSGLDYTDRQLYPAVQIKQDLEQVAPLVPEQRQGILGPARIYRLQGAVGTVGIIHAVSSHFCRECNRLRLTADGQLRPCLLSDHEIDLRSVLRSGADDEKVANVLLRSVAEKPERHCLGQDYQPGERRMQGIGG